MTVAVKTIETGSPIGSGPYLPPVIGGVGLWDHVWGAATLNGVVADGGTVSTVPAAIGTRPLTVSASGKAALSGDPGVAFDVAAGTAAQVSTGDGFSTASAWTLMLVCDVTTGGSQTVRMPGMVAALSATSWTFFGTAAVTATAPGTGKAVFVVTCNAGTVTIWRNGAKAWSGSVAQGTQSQVGMNPTGASKYTFHHMRYAARVLTETQIIAASADARAFHGF